VNKKRLLKILTIIIVLVVGLFGCYKFMTYDINYTWAKEYKDALTTVAEKRGFKVTQIDEIGVSEIKRSTEKIIKIRFQKVLSSINLMNYGHEFGESITLTSDNSTRLLNCKGWCLDDHLIGLEIEYSYIDDVTLKNLKDDFEHQFDNYKIIWTQLQDK
jgi:hypothetical protein